MRVLRGQAKGCVVFDATASGVAERGCAWHRRHRRCPRPRMPLPRLRVIRLIACQHGPDHPRVLVRDGHQRLLVTAASRQPHHPLLQPGGLVRCGPQRSLQRRARAVDQQRAGPIRLNSEPGPISGFSAVRKRRIGHAAGSCTAGRFGRLRRTGNRPAVHNPCGSPRSSLKPLSSSPTDWRSRTRPVSFDQGSSAAGVCCRTR